MEIKNEIDKLAEMMQREFGAVRSEIGGIKGEMGSMKSEMDEKFNLVLNSQDEVLKRLDNLETDNTMGAGSSRRHEDKLENHEERIVMAEEKLGIGETV